MSHPVDAMYRSQRRVAEGFEAMNSIGKEVDCTPIIIGAAIGGLVGCAIPPHGALAIPGAIVGGLVGFAVGDCVAEIRRDNMARTNK